MDSTRVDRWLHAVRIVKTRAEATDSCRGGHVRVNGSPAKAAGAVKVGDRVAIRRGGRDLDLEVTRVIDKRVGAAVAVECYVDHSPPPPARERYEAPVARRDPGAGRPTKRDRRRLDRLRGR